MCLRRLLRASKRLRQLIKYLVRLQITNWWLLSCQCKQKHSYKVVNITSFTRNEPLYWISINRNKCEGMTPVDGRSLPTKNFYFLGLHQTIRVLMYWWICQNFEQQCPKYLYKEINSSYSIDISISPLRPCQGKNLFLRFYLHFTICYKFLIGYIQYCRYLVTCLNCWCIWDNFVKAKFKWFCDNMYYWKLMSSQHFLRGMQCSLNYRKLRLVLHVFESILCWINGHMISVYQIIFPILNHYLIWTIFII